jgi:hypothetical protein
MPANGKPNGRFELPKLTPVNFSLTDGTNIPPPPISPIEEKPPPPAKTAATTPPQQTQTQNSANGGYDGHGRTDGTDIPPVSPASTKRPSSIRKFLSRKSLNANYTNGTNHNISSEDLTSMGRPDSPASFMTDGRPGLKSRKSGSWFKRLASAGAANRNSVVLDAPVRVEQKKPMGPPPPKLPELNQLKAKIPEDDEGSLGADDMFKNIK